MTDDAAALLAVVRFGETGAVREIVTTAARDGRLASVLRAFEVGYRPRLADPLLKRHAAAFVALGTGHSWEEAFADAAAVPLMVTP